MAVIGEKLISSQAYERRQRDHVAYQPIGVRAAARQRSGARLSGNGSKPMRFVSLHHHSTFSFLDGFQLPEAHVRRAGEINMGAVAMTEHGNIFSHVRLEKAASAAGVKPIFGCEFYMGWTDEDRRTQRKNHLTVIAKDATGYQNLLTLVTRSWVEGFYYEPTVDWRWLVEHQKGLVILSGCQGGALFTALVGGKHVPDEEASYKRGLKVARWMAQRFDDFYIEVQAFPELAKTRLANPMLARIARVIKRPLVATMDCHYTAPEEAEIQQVLHNVRPGEKRTLEEMVRDWGYDVPLCPPPTDMALYRRLCGTGLTKAQATQAIVSSEEIGQGCNVELPRLPRPEYPLPEGFDSPVELWRDWLIRGWRYRGCHTLASDEQQRYKEQLAREMEVIEAKGYVNYFLMVADAIVFAKDEQIPVGPARGSAAASLACWLLRITEVNPMLYDNLVFERFIDWSREDMPDIDIDFATYGRPLVRDYLVDKYGEGCVNNVGTFTMYKSKMALDDVARVHKIPRVEVDKIKDLLLERSSGDLRSSATIEDTVDQFDEAYEAMGRHPELQYAMDLEGNAKGFGVHAAGLVVSTEPITGVCAVLERKINDEVVQVISMDKYDCERQGLDKLDFLALNTMDMIAESLRVLDMTVEQLYAIPLNDPKTLAGFKRNDVIGIFQFDGRATRIVNGMIQPDTFDELVTVNALSRPGPLHNGAFQGYASAKAGRSEPERIHPALDQITADTYCQIIFQEQILRIVRDIGGFDWTHAAYIRRIISKKLGDQEFNRQGDRFLEGARKVHERMDVPAMDDETAKKVWGMCITAGSYAFNAAHSTAYTMIGVWTMWIKQHHPEVFYAASMAKLRRSSIGSGNKMSVTTDRNADLMRDAVKGNGPRKPTQVLPPGLDSEVTWRVKNKHAVQAGWEQIPGIGPKMAHKIGKLKRWDDLADVPGVGPKKMEVIQAFANSSDPFNVHRLDKAIASISSDLAEGIEDGRGKRLPVPTHSAFEVLETPPGAPVVFLGQPIHRNVRDIFEANRAKTGVALNPEDIKRPDLSQWIAAMVTDGDEIVTFMITRYKYPKFKELMWSFKLGGTELLLAKGKKGNIKGWGKTAIVFVDNVWVLEAD